MDKELQKQNHNVVAEHHLVYERFARGFSIDKAIEKEYEYGFTTDIEQETIAPGLNKDVIRLISSKKDEPQWLLDWRLKAYDQWLKMDEPDWSKLNFSKIDFQSIYFYL